MIIDNNKLGELIICYIICTGQERYDKFFNAECATDAILSDFPEVKEIEISCQFNILYLNAVLGVFPAYSKSTVKHSHIKAIERTGLECSL